MFSVWYELKSSTTVPRISYVRFMGAKTGTGHVLAPRTRLFFLGTFPLTLHTHVNPTRTKVRKI